MIDIMESEFYNNLHELKYELQRKSIDMAEKLGNALQSDIMNAELSEMAIEIRILDEKIKMLEDLIDDFDMEFYKE